MKADSTVFERRPLPRQFCNIGRLWEALEARGLDGIVVTTPLNVFYTSGFNGIAHNSDEPRPCAVILSRHAPDHPIMVVADYYLSSLMVQPSWIEDIRPFRAVMMGLDIAPQASDIDRFIPRDGGNADWIARAREHYRFDMDSVVRGALADLGLTTGAVAFDDMGYGLRLGDVEVSDGYDPMMSARMVKTREELALIERSTELNQKAIERTVAVWDKGASWRDINCAYHQAAVELGGFIRDPGGMVWGHPRGADPAITLQTGLEDFEVEAGSHILFDCHGTLDLYCWDGGKSWCVGDTPSVSVKKTAAAVNAAAETVRAAMRPGNTVSQIQEMGRETFRKCGVSDAEAVLIFFHGLGLSHMDLELKKADGTPNSDWAMQENMVVPLHLLYPGGESERVWLEDVIVVERDGGRPLFDWGFEPFIEL